MKKDELTIIRDIRNKFSFPETLGIGIGDDAAVLNFKEFALLTTDLMIEDVHFDLSYTSFYHLGFKIVSVNVSDIYAMGGDLRGFLFSLGAPQTYEEFDELFEGIRDALNYYEGFLIGGDLSRSEKLMLSGVAIGECEKPVLRKGAEAGDWIFITSFLGLAEAGLYVLRNLSENDKKIVKSVKNFNSINEENFQHFIPKVDRKSTFKGINEILQRHLMPMARKPDKLRRIAKAMMDISDGLLIDLHRLCEESGVGAEIYIDKIPVHPAVAWVAESFNIDAMKLILSGGEDYELLVVSDKENAAEFGLIPVGRIIKDKGIYLIDPEKGRIRAKPEGWQHF